LEFGRGPHPRLSRAVQTQGALPHNFSVTFSASGPRPATNIHACTAFHSGGAQAKMWLPENTPFKSVGLAPAGQLLMAVEDRFFNIRNGVVDAESIAAPGYVPSIDPFFDHQVGLVLTSPPDKLPASDEVVVPYPLNRLNRTLDWLYAHKKVDSNRVALVGHSGGAKGSLMIRCERRGAAVLPAASPAVNRCSRLKPAAGIPGRASCGRAPRRCRPA
jgi:hypothetical protein